MSNETKFTPGPWRWELNPGGKRLSLLGGVPRYDLTVMDFERWGMSGATMRLRDTAHDGWNIMHRVHERNDWHGPQKGREHHADWHQLVTHPDAQLIAAAPDLYDALKRMVDKGEGCPACGLEGATGCGCRYEEARIALAKARGEA